MKRYNLFYCVFLIGFFARCKSEIDNTSNKKLNYVVNNNTNNSNLYFDLSTDSLGKQEDHLEEFRNKWFSRMLTGLEEPILHENNGKDSIFRLTILRTFHHPLSIRIVKSQKHIELFKKIANGAGGYGVGKLYINTKQVLHKSKFNDLTMKLDRLGFWNLPTHSKYMSGKDGSEWILEGKVESNYHFVVRWTPNSKSNEELIDLAYFLFSIANLDSLELKDMY